MQVVALTSTTCEGDEAIVELVALCRETAGPDIAIMVDVAYVWSDWKEALRVLCRLEPFDLFFLEAPLPSDDLEGDAGLQMAPAFESPSGSPRGSNLWA